MEQQLRPTFQTPYDQYKHFIGTQFRVLGTIPNTDPEVGPVYRIQLLNGPQIDALPEEIFVQDGGWNPPGFVYIKDEHGLMVQVTDLPAALEQARGIVAMHEGQKQYCSTLTKEECEDRGAYYFPAAHRHWVHMLKELERLEVSRKDPNFTSEN